MTLCEYLDRLLPEIGPDSLRGAIVFLSLDREIDRFIQLAMGLGPYHPGRESPWSHTVLIADAYRGRGTPILDCTIRTPEGAIAWNESLEDVLKTGITQSGGIYDGCLSDYDDPRVTAFGLKIVQELDADQRQRVVTEARTLQADGYHYDIPGLLRELARLLTGIPIPAGEHLLFCSAFCQAAYRNALGDAGDFQPKVRTEDSTPDDLWYSSLGVGFLPAPALAGTFPASLPGKNDAAPIATSEPSS